MGRFEALIPTGSSASARRCTAERFKGIGGAARREQHPGHVPHGALAGDRAGADIVGAAKEGGGDPAVRCTKALCNEEDKEEAEDEDEADDEEVIP